MMRHFSRPTALAWIIVAAAVAWVVWSDVQRARRVLFISAVDAEKAVPTESSLTGYAAGKRWLIVPASNNASYQWMAETQQMLATGDWRVRRVDYENFPQGREVRTSSPYRWWLAVIARVDHAFSGRPVGMSVERAALWADPLLHLLVLLGAAALAARGFGARASALVAVGAATLFPAATAFLPGVPDNHGLALGCALFTLLPLLLGALETTPGRSVRWFVLSGFFGGIGLWNNVGVELPVLIGLTLGALAANALKPALTVAMPWPTWALTGALVSLATYLLEYAPAHLDLQLRENHPLYGIAWIGVGELLTVFSGRPAGIKSSKPRRYFALVFAALAIAALPVTIAFTSAVSPFAADAMSNRLATAADAPSAKNLATWLVRDGLNLRVIATCLPALALLPFAWALLKRTASAAQRTALMLALGPALVALLMSCARLQSWSTFDIALLGVGAAAFPLLADIPSLVGRTAWTAYAVAIGCGIFSMLPPRTTSDAAVFTKWEAQSLIDRSLSHWIADRAGPAQAVVLCAPDQTPHLTFHGGFRGLGTANWENQAGVTATIRIATATTSDEAKALILERGITHLILPSWDTELDEFVKWTLPQPENSFLFAIRKWALPPWLRLVPYPLPSVPGFEDQSVTVLEVTDNADRATSLAWTAEAALEMQRPDLAAAASESLQAFPANLSALIARALVEKARTDEAAFEKLASSIDAILRAGGDRRLPWERRVSLCVVLAQSNRMELARKQVERCLSEVTEEHLRTLTTGGLFRLQKLAKAFDMKITDTSLRRLAHDLLPKELNAQL